MKREDRYIVLKLKDIEAAAKEQFIQPGETGLFNHLAGKVALYRHANGKAPLQCVVVESDWPEYEPVWRAIEARVDGTPASLIQEVVNEPNVDAALRSFSEDPTNDNAFFLIREIMGKYLPRVQAKAPPAAAPVDLDKKIAEIEAEADMVVVPRGVLGAAGSAIDKKRDAPTVLALLRHYSTGAGVRKAEMPTPAPVGYFAYSEDSGFETFDTADKAAMHALEEIDANREDACDGWPEEVDSICWGVIMQRAKGFDLQDIPKGERGHTYQSCNYRLEPVLPGEVDSGN